eukprot:TRINITY_DN29630_c0_g1_i1.p1 TRINITY_DN29630_c0_g1~~TRINITY_DN29630_c0_g1_i1.p1  ORF type:complete len:231 (-),score=34.38 TRINITY_DN29630_c0_g1_i1:21-632(-)
MVPPQAQLRGPVIQLAFQQLCLARWRKHKRGMLPVANMLVFGVGYDSSMWLDMNRNGTTEFVEHSLQWISMQSEDVQAIVSHVKYDTLAAEAGGIICNVERLSGLITNELPPKLGKRCWDIIFVDAPPGPPDKMMDFPATPGRMQSIWTAAQLAGPETVVFVDDCSRRIESEYSLKYLAIPGSYVVVVSNGHGGYVCVVFREK